MCTESVHNQPIVQLEYNVLVNTSLESVMISGKKLTFSFSTFPRPPPLARVLSMVKIRPETPRFRCCTCKPKENTNVRPYNAELSIGAGSQQKMLTSGLGGYFCLILPLLLIINLSIIIIKIPPKKCKASISQLWVELNAYFTRFRCVNQFHVCSFVRSFVCSCKRCGIPGTFFFTQMFPVLGIWQQKSQTKMLHVSWYQPFLTTHQTVPEY